MSKEKEPPHSCPIIDDIRAHCKEIEGFTDDTRILALLDLITSKGERVKKINIDLRSRNR